MMENVGIVGYGYVGKAMEKFFADHYKIFVYDPPYIDANKLEGVVERHNGQEITYTKEQDAINACDLVVVCVPTPEAADGSVDLSIIEGTFEWLNAPLILIKSTVPPGTTDEMVAGKAGKWIDRNIVFSPEYIGEGKYVVQWWKDRGYPHPLDMKYHDFHIFGGRPEATAKVLEFYKRIVGPEVRYMQTEAKTAELVKYMENSWGATKVTFCNEFKSIADAIGVDYNELRELFLLDGRVERMHTLVFDDKRGFGGKCFPKDVSGIVKYSKKAGYEPKLLAQVLESNKDFNEMNPKPH